MAKETRRVNMNIPVDALERIDEYAESMAINRTSAILVLTKMALDSQKGIDGIAELMKLIKSENLK